MMLVMFVTINACPNTVYKLFQEMNSNLSVIGDQLSFETLPLNKKGLIKPFYASYKRKRKVKESYFS